MGYLFRSQEKRAATIWSESSLAARQKYYKEATMIIIKRKELSCVLYEYEMIHLFSLRTG